MQKFFNYYNNKKIAVTGASGFLGSFLLNKLSKYSRAASGISRKRRMKLNRAKVLTTDLKKLENAKRVVKKFDIFFLLSANTNINKAEMNPMYNFHSNVVPVINLILAANFLKKKIKIIFTSTGTVFGLNKKKIISESIVPLPVTVYDKHKLLVEQILEMNTKLKIIDAVSLRVQNVYGKSITKSRDKTRGVLNKMIKNSIEGRPIKLFGGGNYYRDFLHISDLVHAIIFAGMSNKVSGLTLNVGSNKLLKIKDACKIIQSELLKFKNKKVKIINTRWPKNHNLIDKRNYILNSNKFRKLTKWKDKIAINKGIGDTIKLFDIKNVNEKFF